MKKMMSLTFFAFTPAFGPYAADKVMTAGPVEDDPAVEVACKGLYGFMKTALVVVKMIFRKSITAKFIATVFVVLLAGQILGTVLFALNARASMFDSLEARIRRISAIAAGVSAGPLQSYDYSLIDTYLAEIINDEEITSVRVLDSTGNAEGKNKDGTCRDQPCFRQENTAHENPCDVCRTKNRGSRN